MRECTHRLLVYVKLQRDLEAATGSTSRCVPQIIYAQIIYVQVQRWQSKAGFGKSWIAWELRECVLRVVYLLIHSVTYVTLDTSVTDYNTTYNIWISTQYNIINNSTKFKDQLEVTTSRYMCIYINISES